MIATAAMVSEVTMSDRVHNIIWATLAVLAWISAFAFLWTLRPIDPVPRLLLTVAESPRAGEALRVRVDYCKAPGYTPAAVRWALIDGVTIMLPPTLVTLATGCHVVTLILPSTPHMTPGEYLLRVEGVYTPYPWRAPIIVTATSPPFTVAP